MNAREEINKLVGDGVITQEEADRLLEAMKQDEEASRWDWSGGEGAPQGGPDAQGAQAQAQAGDPPFQTAADASGTNGAATSQQGEYQGVVGQDVQIRVDVGQVRILPAADGKVSYRIELHSHADSLDNYEHWMRQEAGETVISVRTRFHGRFWFGRGRTGNVTVFIYIPREGVRRLTARNSVGDCRVEGFSADSLDIRCDVGKLLIENVRMQEGDFRTNVGKLDFGRGNRVSSKLKLRADVGDMHVCLPVDGNYQVTYRTDVGGMRGTLASCLQSTRSRADVVGERGTLQCGSGGCRIDCRVATGGLTLDRE